MESAHSVLSAEIQRHGARRDEIDDEIAELRNEARALDLTLRGLRDTLAKLSGADQERNGSVSGSASGARRQSVSRAGSGGATDLVRRFLAEHPEGMRPAEIADAVVGSIDTKSSNPRRLIMNTLLNLARQGEAVRGDDGRYRPVDSPAEAIEGL